MMVVDETGYTHTFFISTHGTEIHKLSVPGKRWWRHGVRWRHGRAGDKIEIDGSENYIIQTTK